MSTSLLSADADQAARANAFALPLDQIDVSNPDFFVHDTVGHYFERLRRDDPVHHSVSPLFGEYWSITKYKDIMQVDTSHGIFSSDSAHGGISIADGPREYRFANFISMDPPRHDEQRKTVSPIVAPGNLATMASTIRERTCKVLDSLPRNETFNWVDLVSIELTTQMLATLFDFPFEDRKLLTWWSDVATTLPGTGGIASITTWEEKQAELVKCLTYFTGLWNQRINAPPANDLISMLAHAPATRNMGPKEFLGNLVLLIVGGNDTTRNSMTGGLLALNQNPAQFAKLRANPALVESMVPEIIRWQTPLAHMRRTATRDVEIGGKTIKTGEKVVMWYVSGNRDDSVIDRPNDFIIDRP
ncbi:MAG: hypothetical protein RLZZ401_937, partial [Pseudomonadota bacterium]